MSKKIVYDVVKEKHIYEKTGFTCLSYESARMMAEDLEDRDEDDEAYGYDIEEREIEVDGETCDIMFRSADLCHRDSFKQVDIDMTIREFLKAANLEEMVFMRDGILLVQGKSVTDYKSRLRDFGVCDGDFICIGFSERHGSDDDE